MAWAITRAPAVRAQDLHKGDGMSLFRRILLSALNTSETKMDLDDGRILAAAAVDALHVPHHFGLP